MNCEEVDRFLDPYLDRELELSRQSQLEQHLNSCPACQSLAQECREFRSFLKENAPAYEAPPELKVNVLAMVRRKSAKPALTFLRRPWAYAAAVLVLGLCGISLFAPDRGKELSSELSGPAVLHHSQSVAANHLVDIASADQEMLRHWFAAKLDFTPPLVDLLASGYTLLGGRTDVIQDRTVATLVYKHDENIVSLFCWPSNKEQLSSAARLVEGYHVRTWSNADCNYIVVAKDKSKLDEFVDSLQGRPEYRSANPGG
jgi:anti-sigma factor RsiW